MGPLVRARSVALLVLVAALGLVAACGDDGGSPEITVERAVIPAPAGGNGALYLDLVNGGDGDDRLVAVRTDVAESVELHETVSGDDGLTRMEHRNEIEVPAGGTVSLAPGGLHVMLLGVDRLVVGDLVTVELELAESGRITVEVPVGTVADALD